MKLYTKVEEPADVRVLIPYTKVTPKLQLVVDCLRIQKVQPEMVLVGKGDEYHSMLRDEWAKGETFFVVEQDVFVWQGGIHMLNDCDEDWCTLPTLCHGRVITTTFGCVKFGRQMIEENPGFWDDIPAVWFHLDSGFADKMGWPFVRPHAHYPMATHLNEVQWGDDISTRYGLERKVVWKSVEEGSRAVARVGFRVNENGKRVNGEADAIVVMEGYEGWKRRTFEQGGVRDG